jgi:hypothetical protein
MSLPFLKTSKKFKVGAGVSGVAALLALGAAPAFASTTPSPYALQEDNYGQINQNAATVSASGFATGAAVYAQVCDGVSSTSSKFNPTIDCDTNTQPSAAFADSTGTATFPGTDPNLQIGFFRGVSPGDKFNCLAPLDNPKSTTATVPGAPSTADPTTGENVPIIDPNKASWGQTGTATCQVRFTTSPDANSVQASDVFISLTIPQSNGTVSTGPSPTLPESPLTIALPIGAVALFGLGGVVLMRKRRHPTAV